MIRTALVLTTILAAAGCSRGAEAPQAERAPAPAPAPAAASQPSATRLTVLVTPTIARQESEVPVQETHYSISEAQGDVTMSLTGSLATEGRGEAAADEKPVAPAGTVRDGVPVYVSENEGIKTATWIEKGTAYALDIECRSDRDERCRSSDYILGVVKSLVDVTKPK